MKTITFPYDKNWFIHLFCTFLSLGAALIIFQGCDPLLYNSTGTYQTTTEIYRPDWAPTYESTDQARYYYLPDVEAYYDLHTREYICLEDGNWVFTAILPYASFNINNAFVVVLDKQVSQPWRQHHLYVSHYPRYYYRTVYNSPKNAYTYHDMRGFNENGKKDIFRKDYSPNQRQSQNQQYQRINNRSNSTGRQESNQNTQQGSRYSTPQQTNTNSTSGQTDRNQNTTGQSRRYTTTNNQSSQPASTNTQGTQNSNQQQNSRTTGQQTNQQTNTNTQGTNNINKSQPAEYKGRNIGKPVKVQRDMKVQKEETTKQDNSQKETNSSNQGSSRRR